MNRLNWTPAPKSTHYGDDMMVSSLHLSADDTATISCHASQVSMVESLLDSAVQQENRQLKAENELLRIGMKGDYDLDAWLDFVRTEQELKARIARLEQLIEKFPCWYAPEFCEKSGFPEGGVLNEITKVMCESPQQSLASIQADYANQLANEIKGGMNHWGKFQIWLNEKAQQLRQ